jgi:hypothetical protein
MAYGVVTDVPAPIEMYDAIHAELKRRAGDSMDGLLVHIGRPTSTGFQIVEVWESKEDFDRYDRELIGPVVAELSGGQAPPDGQQGAEEFEVRGLVLSGARVFA